MSMPVSLPICTPKKCGRLPAPEVAYDALPGFAFAQVDELAPRLRARLRPDGDREVERRADADRREVLQRIERQLLRRVRNDRHRADRHHHDRRAVRGCGLDRVRRDAARSAGTVLDDDRLARSCPSSCRRPARAMRSAVPPAAKPTRIRTGRSILSCAGAGDRNQREAGHGQRRNASTCALLEDRVRRPGE